MKLRFYQGLDPDSIPNFKRFAKAIEADDIARADIKKIGDNLYRAKLGRSARLLFAFYSHSQQTECLVLEYLPNHEYKKSRFLSGGVTIDEDRIAPLADIAAVEPQPLVYLNPNSDRFHVLDKVLSFDDYQEAIFQLPPPLILVGSAGSGKTALTLAKMRQAVGNVLYVSLSPFLVDSARALYFANNYHNEDQTIDFLSLAEFMESIAVPEGREATYQDFDAWFQRHKAGSGLKDSHALFEEFRGVITAPVTDGDALSRADYIALGVRQSIFAEALRERVYDFFERWRAHLGASQLYDPNLLAHAWRSRKLPSYDFVVVDEVQDFTNIQLWLVLQCLQQSGDFLLCGDANQIVHPNFFSWSKLKSLFFENRGLVGGGENLAILHANYRNSPLVTNVANRILKLKHARFGSVDKESNHLVKSQGAATGQLQLIQDSAAIRKDLDARTGRSTRYAVIVMHAEDKAAASEAFSTPLVFSIQEAKGLEYENIILFNMIAGDEKAFRQIASGVDSAQLDTDTLDYARAKSKTDKSLEIYKFYINALYVAVTRAVKSLYIVETHIDHPTLGLLDLERFTGELSLDKEESSLDDWQREARKLELQGKHEQAEAIHDRILKRKPVPWPVLDRDAFDELWHRARDSGHKKDLLRCYEYALLHRHEPTLSVMHDMDYKPSRQPEEKALKQLYRNHFMTYDLSSPNAVLNDTELYGVDHRTVFNWTPLMVAARCGNATLVTELINRGADPTLIANHGLNTAQQVLELATIDSSYAARAAPSDSVYRAASTTSAYALKMAPVWAALTSTQLSVQVHGRLVKLHPQLMALFLLNLCIAHFHRSLGRLAGRGTAFSAGFLADLVADLPEQILPEKRQRQQYISSVLSGNEIERDAPYNRRLFKRIRRGEYIINPNLKLRVQGAWVGIHQILPLSDLGLPVDPSDRSITHGLRHAIDMQQWQEAGDYWRTQRKLQLDEFRATVQGMIDEPVDATVQTEHASASQAHAESAPSPS